MKAFTLLLGVLFFSSILNGQENINIEFAEKLCSKGIYHVNQIQGNNNPEGAKNDLCIPKSNGIPNSHWFSWTIDHPGSIEVLIKPIDPENDFDFEVLLLHEDQWKIVRCMATGENVGEENNDHCLGMTGMIGDRNNIKETLGCDPDKTNFTAPIYTVKNQTYLCHVLK